MGSAMRLRPSSPAGGEILGHLHRPSQAAEQTRLADLLLANVQNKDGTPPEDTGCLATPGGRKFHAATIWQSTGHAV